jgi:hypothetical protein
MGYYTAYSLSLGDVTEEQQKQITNHLREKDVVGWVLNNDLCCSNPATWYDAEKDLREISKEFPDVLFELHGEGEETGDIWDRYFKNGKMQYCPAEIVIPPFDETKLK